ncbi:SET and MYND domain-containing protein 4-like isoform X2 [Belonocnema kinseyi]|uniref:SET and MYND domain-containing protein 4-like isoform X2 n=1 Tax=Belonocnema kinseyi TaxID=2817044 RepID=UPI00143E0976|nr:SET and MYND domain-containing protein 4-like isoform X2 [Belonocnema kinseyi]
MDATFKMLLKKMEAMEAFYEDEQEAHNFPYFIDNNPFRLECMMFLLGKFKIIPKVSCDNKNAEKAIQYKDDGNSKFLNAKTSLDFLETFKLYTQSIAYALNNSKELALAYANRSAILIHVGKYQDCLADINRALNLNYPNNLKSKVFLRKAECLLALGNPEAKKAHKSALKWLKEVSNETIKIKMKDKLENFFNMDRKFYNEEEEEIFSVEWDYSEDAQIPCASDGLEIKYNTEYGRHVVATRDFPAGEIIIAEKPYAQVLAYKNMYTHCAHCLKVTWSSIPCCYCVYAVYCSAECRDIARKLYHDIECSVLGFLIESGLNEDRLLSTKIAILALRETKSISNLKSELKNVNACKDKVKKGFSDDGRFLSDKYRSVYSLHINNEKISPTDIFRMCFHSAFLMYALATRSNLFGTLSSDISWN